jgi:signal transduction histidine kinase
VSIAVLAPALAEFRRLLRLGGLLALLMVCVPVLLHGGLDPRRFAPWVVVVLLFAVAFWQSSSGARPRLTVALLALEAACVMAMVLLLCDGFEGALLVLVALQLGGRTPRRTGVAWILVQSALLAAAVAIHWSPRPALLLVPPYLGFQLLAFFVADVLARDAGARALAEENSRLAERLRIARELHDVVGHRLTALSLNLEAATRTAQGPSRDPLTTAHGLAKAALSDLRSVVAQLRDPERMNLSEALRTLADEMPRPLVHLTVPGSLCQNDPDRALTLLRCTQEIVTNAARHASADNLWIEIAEVKGSIELRARDDGCGAGELRAGNGLRGMRERVERAGGQLEINTSSGSGFAIRATFPPAARTSR